MKDSPESCNKLFLDAKLAEQHEKKNLKQNRDFFHENFLVRKKNIFDFWKSFKAPFTQSSDRNHSKFATFFTTRVQKSKTFVKKCLNHFSRSFITQIDRKKKTRKKIKYFFATKFFSIKKIFEVRKISVRVSKILKISSIKFIDEIFKNFRYPYWNFPNLKYFFDRKKIVAKKYLIFFLVFFFDRFG